MLTDTARSPFAKTASLPAADVTWTGGLYKERFDVCCNVTVPHLQNMFESPDISHVLENFKIAAGDAEGDFDGTVFGDGDFYKWMEAAAYTAVHTNNQAMLDCLESYIELFARAQQPDGYLSTKQIIGERQKNGVTRGGDINDFEVYNMGHMFTSACVYYRLTGRDSFLRIAEKAAGYLKNLYAEAAAKGEVKTAVCPSHYMGLVELYRTTGKVEYLDLAKQAIELRDSVKNGLDDNQDRIPLKTHRKVIGHAVRSNYLYAGVADLCLENGDGEYREVLDSVWHDLITTRMYINGGCGALYNGASPFGNFMNHQLVHQAYGYEYQLPNVTAYNETCANLGCVFWAWRMFALDPKAEYMDILERVLLNSCLSGVSLDGKRFFYENMLRRAKKLPYDLIWGQERTEYILSYCCPPNLARTIAESSEYAFSSDADGLWTGLYGDCTVDTVLPSGVTVKLHEKTEYPFDGQIRFGVSESSGPWTLHLRIPSWAKTARLCVEGIVRTLSNENAGTYLAIPMEGVSEVVLDLPAEPRLIRANGLVEEDRNQVCVMAGPLLYCVEAMDTEVSHLEDLMLPLHPVFEKKTEAIDGVLVTVLYTQMYADDSRQDRDALYETFAPENLQPTRVRLVPYYAWDNRGFGEMTVWLPLSWRD